MVVMGDGPTLWHAFAEKFPKSFTAEGRSEERRHLRIRVAFTDEARDDRTRARLFREDISSRGRCDEVLSALMERPGIWSVHCSPGYRYRLKFSWVGGGIVATAWRLR